MKIYLLTHERELDRPTNTGRLALDVGGDTEGVVERIVWNRVAPCPKLLSVLKAPNTGLLYPVAEVPGEEIALADCDQFVLLDATWQEARKMFNRSPYLHPVKRVALNTTAASRYALRRNQRQGGLCTVECVIEILRSKGRMALAEHMQAQFDLFNIR